MQCSWLRTLIKGSLITIAAFAIIVMATLWVVGKFLPKFAEHTFRDVTQFKLSIGTNHTNLLKGRIGFEDISITNPPAFSDPNLAFFKQLDVTVPLSLKLLTFDDIAELTVDEIVFDVQDIFWVINQDGSVNWITLGHQLHEAFSGQPKPAEAKPNVPVVPVVVKPPHVSRPIPFIRTLRVRLGTLNYVSYLNPAAPDKKTIVLNYERTFHNVEDINAVFAAITADLVQFQLSELVKNLFQQFTSPEQINQAIQKAAEQLKSLDKESLNDVKNAAKDIFKSFKM
jgi:hypothetical protein